MDMRSLITLVEKELPMDPKSRMRRAVKLGYTTKAYHGSVAVFDGFSLKHGKPNMGGGHGPMFASNPGEASGYADMRAQQGESAMVYPVLIRMQNPYSVSYRRDMTQEEFKRVIGDLPIREKSIVDSRYALDLIRRYYSKQFEGNGKKAWTAVYKHFKKLGYDGFVFPENPSDHDQDNPTYTKYVLFDTKNVRSIFAAFDPAKRNSSDLLA